MSEGITSTSWIKAATKANNRIGAGMESNQSIFTMFKSHCMVLELWFWTRQTRGLLGSAKVRKNRDFTIDGSVADFSPDESEGWSERKPAVMLWPLAISVVPPIQTSPRFWGTCQKDVACLAHAISAHSVQNRKKLIQRSNLWILWMNRYKPSIYRYGSMLNWTHATNKCIATSVYITL